MAKKKKTVKKKERIARISKVSFQKALKNSGGNQARIAEKLEVSRQAVNLFLNKHSDMRALLEHEMEMVIDVAEDNIDSDILVNRNVETSKWKLTNSKRGKARGYGQKQEVAIETNLSTTALTKEERQAEIKRLLGK